jgi:hypothetical protein
VKSWNKTRTSIAGAVAVLILASFSLTAMSSTTDKDAGLAAMAKLDFLVGEWQGEGWMQRGPGEPNRFRSHERVERQLGGRIIAIHGQHRDAKSDEVIHDAFAVLSHLDDGYRFNSYLADGRQGDYRGRMEGDAFVWEMQLPDGAVIRYDIRVVDGEWRETGAMSRDGETWFEFFGMTLRRVP